MTMAINQTNSSFKNGRKKNQQKDGYRPYPSKTPQKKRLNKIKNQPETLLNQKQI
jgi:hypothetical protein